MNRKPIEERNLPPFSYGNLSVAGKNLDKGEEKIPFFPMLPSLLNGDKAIPSDGGYTIYLLLRRSPSLRL
jgi:hypothetical protein